MKKLEEVEAQRTYELFSVLAGVRNNAGVSPIVPPRGLPSDLSIGASETLLTIGHDPSWLLLREILDFDWFGDRLDLQWTWMTRKRWSLFESPERVRFRGSYAEYIGMQVTRWFLETVLVLGPPDDTRVVFSFDS